MKYAIFFSIFFASSGFCSQYVLMKSTFSNAGGSSSSENYILKDATGQSITGQSESSNYIEQAGFYTYSKKELFGIESDKSDFVPKVFSLSQNWPNPVIGITRIKYGIPRLSQVTIRIYDVTGRVVRTLLSCMEKPGFYNLSWDGTTDRRTGVAQGLYFIRMVASDFRETRKLIFLR